jgi:pimeloyl-ACP methyl ester carboxylesterase
MDVVTDRFSSFDSVEIVFQQWGSDATRPPVLLHHGFIADGTLNWVGPGIVAALVGAGRHVVAIDARGHGQSGKPHDPAAYGETNMARDLMLLADRLGATSYDLVGYSMGAIVSLLVATQDPRVRRLATGGVGAAVVELGGVDSRALPQKELIAAFDADDPATIRHPQAAGFRAFADALGCDRKALGAHVRSIHDKAIPLDRIRAATLVLAGDADPLAVRPEVLAEAIPGATLQIVSGDHLSALQDPRFIATLLSFLQ